jgi:hypothetical protein
MRALASSKQCDDAGPHDTTMTSPEALDIADFAREDFMRRERLA